MGGEDGCEGRLEAIIRICEIVNSVGQGNFTFVREKSGNFKPMAVATMTLSLCNERETQQ